MQTTRTALQAFTDLTQRREAADRILGQNNIQELRARLKTPASGLMPGGGETQAAYTIRQSLGIGDGRGKLPVPITSTIKHAESSICQIVAPELQPEIEPECVPHAIPQDMSPASKRKKSQRERQSRKRERAKKACDGDVAKLQELKSKQTSERKKRKNHNPSYESRKQLQNRCK